MTAPGKVASGGRPAGRSATGAAGPVIDLTKVTESTRRALYDAVVAVQFVGDEEESLGAYSPDEAQLNVFFALGRWIATWLYLEYMSADLPAAHKRAVLRIDADPGKPFGLGFTAI